MAEQRNVDSQRATLCKRCRHSAAKSVQFVRLHINPYTYPDDLTQASSALNDANAYTPVSVSIKIDEGETLRLGIRKQSTESADWVAYDNFQLFYVENLTDVKNISVEHTSDDVYDIQGRLVRKNSNLTGIPKGVYIINGNKIMVK